MHLSSFQFRLWNEVPTILLLAIILLAVYKNTLNGLYALLTIVVFALVLILLTKLYKKARERNSNI